jgi:aspartyl-tRNA(Asn)/glutamyl-tRNA(Gln) amidotransferase subunit A
MSKLVELTLSQIIAGLRKGDFSSCELTQAYLARIDHLESQLHAFITLTPDLALAQAEHADQQYAAWRVDSNVTLPPLAGVPIAIKDVLSVAGVRCTCGSKILEDFVPPYNATSVERLLESGMLIVGKTNTDEFAMGSSTENSAYRTTHNPWDVNRVPGGSSGGSAAAVAARLAPVALGTDTGGSVRQPASFCGVTGIKPTYGRVSRYGLVAFGSSLDVVGVLGHDAVDSACIYKLIAGHDQLDSTSADRPIPEFKLVDSLQNSLTRFRIGVPDEYFIPGMQPEVETAVRKALSEFENLGAEVMPISLPHTKHALPVYYLIAPAEASANLARYDGIRYGPRVQSDRMWDIYSRTRGDKLGSEVKRRIMLGTYALSTGYYDAYYGQAQKVRTLIKNDFDQAFENVDLIAAPVTPTTAFPIGEHLDDPLSMYLEDVLTIPASLAGVPAISFPVGFDKQGLPIGMQLMGPQFGEEILFQTTHSFQLVTNWHLSKPKL